MARRRGGIRGIAARLESNANHTMATARGAVLSIEDLVQGLIEDLQDGVAFKLEIGGRQLPIKLWMMPNEPLPGATKPEAE